MRLKYCSCCGSELTRITTKTAVYKAVCTECEITYKLVADAPGKEIIKLATSSPSQMTEAAMNKK